ncbi:MAG: tryptophan--tRNA ligase [Acidipropionibacterium acidipropionici]|jgi:tryptophanyl-tRNA synthetase|uniref:Tryptophan--tRNA ligase n=2 Tax=Acidipropionibacterium acidipropionici TaxID=1748 RepID=A0A142KDY9_9ACTN|nr:tryptophan--tRNA ligase [Acidipropionibacterium acidipropionici]AFV89810.1 Tryptophan--tRNA ligase [Acidipropionibacterium acidipropionici ATCC 4875]ALN15832.1 tryptophan--tRNA ligase [Acidipropionibacterium acidipropionici]AMS04327.1 tryptophan--tRNA ligase [Acidipropionibacterium acidipropionici]AOZ45818.1 tryptophan--tRNA ligase [Acidipropionibacterium acidipropionici]APZ08425.1 tryptophan--tRNA ligase [Acidipropionibacterium acidipropionici]
MTDNSPESSEGSNEATLARSQARSDKVEADLATHPGKWRILTGDRPTGKLHIGHYFGSLANRVRLQNLGVESFLVIADYQVIYDRDGVGDIQENVLSGVADYLAIGIDPARTTIFTHSALPALNQLLLPFLSLVTDAELRRNPTVKDELATSQRPMSGLMLTFPVHQAADILFCKANLVPVGKDQLPHIEQTRVIARRFDERYGRVDPEHPVFPEPEALLSATPHVLGLDGTKMSKSRGNTIEIGMTADQTAKLIKKAKTDAERHISYDPDSRPEVSNLVLLTALCEGSDPLTVAEEIGDGGSGTLKKRLTASMNDYFAPIRARRAEVAADEGYLRSVLRDGNERAGAVADQTLDEVRRAMKMVY